MTDHRKTHTAISVANYLLKRDKTGMDKLKLIKLVYLCHAWHLADFGEPLVTEPAEAWGYGPIYPAIYRRTESYGFDEPVKFPLADGSIAKFTKSQKELVDDVHNQYGHLNGFDLMWMSHQDGTPWDITWTQVAPWYKPWAKIDYKIPNDLIQRHYLGKN